MTAGIDTPDRRGRTGLDRHGRDLTGNPRVRIHDVEVLSCNWYVLRNTTFDYQHSDGHWTREQRETYDRGDGATILLYNTDRRTILLTQQFRLPAYVNGHPDGMLLETAAGLLDGHTPHEAIRREAQEETGHHVGTARPVFVAYMSPGSVTERLHFFAAPYDPGKSTNDSHGITAEGEDIRTIEIPFPQALTMIRTSEIADAKTIMLIQWAALDGPFRTATPIGRRSSRTTCRSAVSIRACKLISKRRCVSPVSQQVSTGLGQSRTSNSSIRRQVGGLGHCPMVVPTLRPA
ncbi:NUDIX domain-containing protein [Nocardia sp. NPDC059091]|uniref:NUDIX domain-containing protein n=1 Tax=unclassified Nocardia TaxID=2637762 RepID=UPI00368348B3